MGRFLGHWGPLSPTCVESWQRVPRPGAAECRLRLFNCGIYLFLWLSLLSPVLVLAVHAGVSICLLRWRVAVRLFVYFHLRGFRCE